ncbi:MAG: hypothetical protein C4294_07140, partial [Nitrospiraceae bacterium]
KWTAESAVEDILRRLSGIVHHASGDQLLIAIILDGENPWEHYFDGGERFLSGLYHAFTKGDLNSDRVSVVPETIRGASERHPPATRLHHLHSGSWINTDFKIWLGHPEDNRAWELLRETRARLVEMAKSLTPDQAEGAWKELYAAEGSDWFWWYGDEFQTDYKVEFDRLFRMHLRNVFLLAGAPVPEFLNEPVLQEDRLAGIDLVHLPVRLLSPAIDGLVSDFFEWYGAGIIDPSPPLGTMWKVNHLFTHIGFGYNLETLFLRLDPHEELARHHSSDMREPLFMEWHIQSTKNRFKAVFPLTAAHLD